jgi:hypothetical protein
MKCVDFMVLTMALFTLMHTLYIYTVCIYVHTRIMLHYISILMYVHISTRTASRYTHCVNGLGTGRIPVHSMW